MLTQEAAMKLTQACQREDLEIVSVDTDYRHKRHLENLSILKGEVVTCLCNRTGDVVIKVKDGRIAINREFAEKIELVPVRYVSQMVKALFPPKKNASPAREE